MRHLLTLAIASAWNRRFTLTLTVAAIAFSVAMLLGVERARYAAHESFAHSISGTDLVVGPRTSPVQLMLYAVFRLGEATDAHPVNAPHAIVPSRDVGAERAHRSGCG